MKGSGAPSGVGGVGREKALDYDIAAFSQSAFRFRQVRPQAKFLYNTHI
jgi:hypothetical protein